MTTLDLDALERAARAAQADGPDIIYLSPPCCSDMASFGSGRLWCENDEWSVGDCGEPDEHESATVYVRASAILPLLRVLQERVEGAEKALRPFAKAIEPDETCLSGWRFGVRPTNDDFRAARAYFAARTKAGEPHEQE